MLISLGIPCFLKSIIAYEKYFLLKPKKCQTKLRQLIDDNHLPFAIPQHVQLQNYLYRYREKVLAENYPEVSQYLTEICSKQYSPNLELDETFVIYFKCENGKIGFLMSTHALIKNMIKQSQNQQCFIHLDATFKLIDIGLPVMIMSTETIHHNHRPIAYHITWSESKVEVKVMISEMTKFLKEKFEFDLKPQVILTDNSDAFIFGC